MSNANERRSARYCEICGLRLVRGLYYAGRCAEHQTTKDPDVKLTADAVAAKNHGFASYGLYMAAKEAGRV